MGVETLDRGRQALEHEARRVTSETDAFFRDILRSRGDGRDRLFEAMRHAAIGGGICGSATFDWISAHASRHRQTGGKS